MRYANLALMAAVLAVPMASATVSLEFSAPASLQGALEVASLERFAVRIPEGSGLSLDLTAPGTLVYTNLTTPARVTTPVFLMEPPVDETVQTAEVPAMHVELVAGSGGATLVAFATGRVAAYGDARLQGLGKDGLRETLDDGYVNDRWSRWGMSAPNAVAVVSQGPMPSVFFTSLAISAIEWSNMRVACTVEGHCPSGGGAERQEVGSNGVRVETETVRFERLEGPIVASAAWTEAWFALAGNQLDVTTDGLIHLPVSDISECAGCPPIQDEALRINGLVTLDDIRQQGDGDFSAQMSGDFESVRVGENWVSPTILGGVSAAAAATVAFAIVAKILLAPLFTRLSKQEALEHPKRQAIFAYIREHPGANFREVARNTSIAAGTVRHHLTVLERAGHVVEHQHQGTVRLFENHGKFDHNWADLVLLREPPLALVHAWLKDHPASPQKDILEAMEQLGWSRSTTQHRLARLVDGGLATIRLQGRLKIYSVVERTAPKPIGLVRTLVPVVG